MGTSEAEICVFALGKSREPTGPQVKCYGLDVKHPHRLVCFLVPSVVLLWEAVEPLSCEVHLGNVSQQGTGPWSLQTWLNFQPEWCLLVTLPQTELHHLVIPVRRMGSIPGKQ